MNDVAHIALPRYRSHKVVEAAKIASVDVFSDYTNLNVEGGLTISVSPAYWTKHQPVAGGYYVRYEDGYESFSPAAAFESGYLLLRTAPVMESPEPLLQFFEYAHLSRADLKEVSKAFAEQAYWLVAVTPRNPERTVALRKLLESKDCAVRSLLWKG